jgi:hypothetical protein
MMFPQTRQALVDAGYKQTNYARCRGCSAGIEWWLTPNGQKIPMDCMKTDESPAITHFATCPARELFRKEKDEA